jgi:hypothetical protein
MGYYLNWNKKNQCKIKKNKYKREKVLTKNFTKNNRERESYWVWLTNRTQACLGL